MKVQLITFAGCPNADSARELLRRTLLRAGLEATFEEIDSLSPLAPEHLREWGSPTILIDGVDVGGEQKPAGRSCRFYRDAAGGLQGSPPEPVLLRAIQAAKRAD